jgi:hypothetical protein
MAIYIGSARHDENGKYCNGADGDSLQSSATFDTAGEVSMQTFYVHSKGWDIIRAKDATIATKIAERMKTACNNACIGYDQYNRLGVITYGIDTTTKTECDCSSLLRACVKEASGTDPGNFTTANAKAKLVATGLFEYVGKYASGTTLYTGDILCTCTKGHIVAVVSGTSRTSTSTSTKPTIAKPTIKKGSSGTQVKYLQQDLNYLINADLDVDGSCGALTIAALKKWQKANGLTDDGSYGPASYAKMSELLS